METFDFLNDLPDLYAFCLYGREDDDTEKPPRGSLFGEKDYPQVKCLTVDDEWIRNPE